MSGLTRIRTATGGLGKVIVVKLAPGCDLLESMGEVVKKENIHSGVVLSGTGSLRQATLRNVRSFPDEFPITDTNRIYTPKKEPLELLSLTGNISRADDDISIHCHISRR